MAEQEKLKSLYKQVRGLFRRATRRKSRAVSLGVPSRELMNDPSIKSRHRAAVAKFGRLVEILEEYVTGRRGSIPDTI